MTRPAVLRYADLINDLGVAEGLAYAVVHSVGAPLSLEAVVRRIGGDPVVLADDTSSYRNPSELPPPWVHAIENGQGAVLLFEPLGCLLFQEDVLCRLSEGAQVHGVYWTITGAEQLAYAAEGKLLTVKKMYYPKDPGWGEQPDLLDDDIADVVDDLLASDQTECHPGALALAVVESRTGISPPPELFNYSLPRIAVKDE